MRDAMCGVVGVSAAKSLVFGEKFWLASDLDNFVTTIYVYECVNLYNKAAIISSSRDCLPSSLTWRQIFCERFSRR